MSASATLASPAAVSANPIDDPSFAPFADLRGLLDLAVRAENRLRGHLNPARAESGNVFRTQAVVLSICRLTAVRKTLMDAWKSARTPLSPPPQQRNASSAADSSRSDASGNPFILGVPSVPEIETVSLSSSEQFARINALRSISACSIIPNSKNPDLDLAKIMSDLDKIESEAMELARGNAPGGRRSAAPSRFPQKPNLMPKPMPQPPPPHEEAPSPDLDPGPCAEIRAPEFESNAAGVSQCLAKVLSNSRKHAPVVHPPPE